VKQLLHRGAGNRLGLVAAAEQIPITLADVPGVFHASVRSAYGVSGGVGWDSDSATTAAIGEGLERFSAAAHSLPALSSIDQIPTYTYDAFSLFSPEQLANPSCPWRPNTPPCFVSATRLDDGAEVGVPRALVSLSDPMGEAIATSNGLAAGPTQADSIERALQEVIERDALMTVWLHGLSPNHLTLPTHLSDRIVHLGADVHVLDLTPIYSPWPVVAVCGTLPWRGQRRIGLGAACRPTFDAAIEKAFLEWSQATVFVGVQMAFNRLRAYNSVDEVTTFEDHALYYSARPNDWATVPLLHSTIKHAVPHQEPVAQSAQQRIDAAVAKLKVHNLSVLFVDVTLPEVRDLGVQVVRVLVPGLVSVNPDHRWPYLGGSASMSKLRFPNHDPLVRFPSPFPHPLG
jgi:ribosomal protein S12 methylthiotransferase accessory factor